MQAGGSRTAFSLRFRRRRSAKVGMAKKRGLGLSERVIFIRCPPRIVSGSLSKAARASRARTGTALASSGSVIGHVRRAVTNPAGASVG